MVMADPRTSWIKNYEEVDYSVPFLSDNDTQSSSEVLHKASPVVMPPSTPATSSSPPKTPPSSTFRRSFPSSPLNPSAPSVPSSLRSSSRLNSMARIARVPSEECRAFSTQHPPGLNPMPSRGSMILYRCADPTTPSLGASDDILLPPQPPHLPRSSTYSTSGDSFVTISSDSKYPVASLSVHGERGLVAYAYDPDLDEKDPPDEEDMMHDPTKRYHHDIKKGQGGLGCSPRGFFNITTLIAMVIAILCLFVGYPIIVYYQDNGRSVLITHNTRINSTGQASPANFKPGDDSLVGSFSDYIDRSTPQSAYSFVGTDSITYDLAFSDEFNYTGSTYQNGDNLFWIARNKGLFSPDQITTRDSQLVFRIDPLMTTSSNGQYVSGVLDSTVPFCVGRGFVEVGMMTPDGTAARLFWAGGAWSYTDASPENFVPAGPSLGMDLKLSLSIGVLADKIPKNTPVEQLPTSVSIDYVRYYERRANPGYSRGACDVIRSTEKKTTLDLLHIPR